MKEFKIKQTHCGQDRPYGDSIDEWRIETDASEEEVLAYCKEFLSGGRMSKDEYKTKDISISQYFFGYYEFHEIDGGYIFRTVAPYAD